MKNLGVIKKGFTLIEFMVAITIVATLMIMSYAPYNYYSNKAKVRITAKDISQLLYDSRNLAIHGLDNGEGNLSIGVYFDSSEQLKNKIQVFSFPHDFLNMIPDEKEADINLIKTIKLKPGIEIDKVGGEEGGFLFIFSAISGDGKYSYFPSKQEFPDTEIKIDFSFKDSSVLQKSVNYITNTNIVDY